jgi:hypothetical protein
MQVPCGVRRAGDLCRARLTSHTRRQCVEAEFSESFWSTRASPSTPTTPGCMRSSRGMGGVPGMANARFPVQAGRRDPRAHGRRPGGSAHPRPSGRGRFIGWPHAEPSIRETRWAATRLPPVAQDGPVLSFRGRMPGDKEDMVGEVESVLESLNGARTARHAGAQRGVPASGSDRRRVRREAG